MLENSGVAEPQNIRDKFSEAILNGNPLMSRIQLDTMATIVDSGSFTADYSSRTPVSGNLPTHIRTSQPKHTLTTDGNIRVAMQRYCRMHGGLHMIHECPVLQPLRLQYAALFTPDTDTMRSFFAQQDHMQVFKFVLDCL